MVLNKLNQLKLTSENRMREDGKIFQSHERLSSHFDRQIMER